ncbi:Crp/Fnr family transcriptional regulator [Alsobacter sp. SYSU BS001988]
MVSKAFGSMGPSPCLWPGACLTNVEAGQVVFAQGDHADGVFHLRVGKVKLTTLSQQGKEAIVALLGPGDFFGEACLAGQRTRTTTATAMVAAAVSHFDQAAVLRLAHDDAEFAKTFIAFLLTRNLRLEADLIDQLFNSCEKRLARLLLLLANFGTDETLQPKLPKISQETLAEMIGTTRPRVNVLMNKFRRLGLIAYDGTIEVRPSLLQAVLSDQDAPARRPPRANLAGETDFGLG